jgi:CRP-like cAMP-binding protein
MRDFLQQYITLNEDEYLSFISIARQQLIKKGTVFFEPGKNFDRLYFIEEGLTRCYRIKNGEDITYTFFLQQEYCVDFYSYLNDCPSELFFEALTDTKVYEFLKADVAKGMEAFPKIEKLGRLMAERAYNTVAERLKEMQVDSLEVRYTKLFNRNPALFQKIQQRHIATYLGVKPESLSRIKSQLYHKN